MLLLKNSKEALELQETGPTSASEDDHELGRAPGPQRSLE